MGSKHCHPPRGSGGSLACTGVVGSRFPQGWLGLWGAIALLRHSCHGPTDPIDGRLSSKRRNKAIAPYGLHARAAGFLVLADAVPPAIRESSHEVGAGAGLRTLGEGGHHFVHKLTAPLAGQVTCVLGGL